MEGDVGSGQDDRARQEPISVVPLLFTIFIMRLGRVPC